MNKRENKMKRNELSLWDLQGWYKSLTVTSLEAWKEEDTEVRAEKALGGIMATPIKLQIQEDEQTPNKINSKQFIQRYIIVKLLKVQDKEKILKAAWVNNPLPIGEKQFKWQISHKKPSKLTMGEQNNKMVITGVNLLAQK